MFNAGDRVDVGGRLMFSFFRQINGFRIGIISASGALLSALELRVFLSFLLLFLVDIAYADR